MNVQNVLNVPSNRIGAVAASLLYRTGFLGWSGGCRAWMRSCRARTRSAGRLPKKSANISRSSRRTCLVTEAVRYAKQRERFGRPIGSFQAIKHMLATAQVRLEFARPVVYRAAFGLATLTSPSQWSRDVSHAKIVAAEAAALAARTALQVHGAIGYT